MGKVKGYCLANSNRGGRGDFLFCDWIMVLVPVVQGFVFHTWIRVS